MSKVEKLDLMGVASLAFVAAAVLAAWIATMPGGPAKPVRQAAAQGAVALTQDGRMKLTVTADAPATASVRTAAVLPAASSL